MLTIEWESNWERELKHIKTFIWRQVPLLEQAEQANAGQDITYKRENRCRVFYLLQLEEWKHFDSSHKLFIFLSAFSLDHSGLLRIAFYKYLFSSSLCNLIQDVNIENIILFHHQISQFNPSVCKVSQSVNISVHLTTPDSIKMTIFLTNTSEHAKTFSNLSDYITSPKYLKFSFIEVSSSVH